MPETQVPSVWAIGHRRLGTFGVSLTRMLPIRLELASL